MATLTSILPAPKNAVLNFHSAEPAKSSVLDLAVSKKKGPPPYGQRDGFVPRSLEDFGDGGAFPEIPVAQYPLDMGRKENKSSAKVVPLALDATGQVKYDAILTQGQAKIPGAGAMTKKIFSQHRDLLERDLESNELEKPDDDEVAATTERTREALEKIVNGKIQAAQPVAKSIAASNSKAPSYIRYAPSQVGPGYNSGAKQRVIRLVEMPKDPLEPPKFKHKRVPKGPPSPPVPVMHSPPRKVTVKDQQEWKIPPCISNWKNAKGYTIPLDKRLAADGRGLQETHINDNFAKLSEALYIAERSARDEVEKRATIRKRLAQKEKEKKEDELRKLAEEARKQRSGIVTAAVREGGAPGGAPAPEERETADQRDARVARDALREDRKRDRERDRRLEAAGDKRTKTSRDKDRDVSEVIALGTAAPTSQEGLYDQRLFNQAQGLAAGFGQEDSYNLYDKPLFQGSSAARLYRPTRGEEDDGDESSASRPRPDRDFSGVDRSKPAAARSKPVEFEKDEEADPFGLDQFLTKAKEGKKFDKPSGGSMQYSGGSASRDSYEGGSSRRMDFTSSERDRDRRR